MEEGEVLHRTGGHLAEKCLRRFTSEVLLGEPFAALGGLADLVHKRLALEICEVGGVRRARELEWWFDHRGLTAPLRRSAEVIDGRPVDGLFLEGLELRARLAECDLASASGSWVLKTMIVFVCSATSIAALIALL